MNASSKVESDDADDGPTQYAVRIAPVAAAQAVAQYDWMKANYGVDRAEHWRKGLQKAWSSLATLPLRCPLASEDAVFQEFRPGPVLRVFLYRLAPRGNVWHILFTAHEATSDDPPFVQVQQIRQSTQPPLLEWPEEEN